MPRLKKVPDHIVKTPRKAAEGISAIGVKGKWPIGDLFHARLAAIYIKSPTNARHREQVLRSLERYYPEYNWRAYVGAGAGQMAANPTRRDDWLMDLFHAQGDEGAREVREKQARVAEERRVRESLRKKLAEGRFTPVRRNGVFDPSKLKAIYLAGGPGSGKSFTASSLFDIPRGHVVVTSAQGLKVVNSDPAFEYFLRKEGIDPKALATMTPQEFAAVTEGEDSPRGRAKAVKKKQAARWEAERLGLVIDGTGDEYDKVAKEKARLEALGYDTYMVFVNTSLPVAMARNRARARSLPDDIVVTIWNAVQQNLGKYQQLFGPENMVIVDNTVYGPVPDHIQRAVARFLRAPVRNRIGRAWVEAELAKRKRTNPDVTISAAERTRILRKVTESMKDEMQRTGWWTDDEQGKPVRRFDRPSEWDINNGMCGEWADEAERILGGEAVDLASLRYEKFGLPDGIFEDVSHVVLLLNGRFYDAQDPQGVSDPRELHLIRGVSREAFLGSRAKPNPSGLVTALVGAGGFIAGTYAEASFGLSKQFTAAGRESWKASQEAIKAVRERRMPRLPKREAPKKKQEYVQSARIDKMVEEYHAYEDKKKAVPFKDKAKRQQMEKRLTEMWDAIQDARDEERAAMRANPDLAKRYRDLQRIAAPGSGASDNERATALRLLAKLTPPPPESTHATEHMRPSARKSSEPWQTDPRDSTVIYQNDLSDLNFAKKSIYAHATGPRVRVMLQGFDGRYLRSVLTAVSSLDDLGYAAKVLEAWGEPYFKREGVFAAVVGRVEGEDQTRILRVSGTDVSARCVTVRDRDIYDPDLDSSFNSQLETYLRRALPVIRATMERSTMKTNSPAARNTWVRYSDTRDGYVPDPNGNIYSYEAMGLGTAEVFKMPKSAYNEAAWYIDVYYDRADVTDHSVREARPTLNEAKKRAIEMLVHPPNLFKRNGKSGAEKVASSGLYGDWRDAIFANVPSTKVRQKVREGYVHYGYMKAVDEAKACRAWNGKRCRTCAEILEGHKVRRNVAQGNQMPQTVVIRMNGRPLSREEMRKVLSLKQADRSGSKADKRKYHGALGGKRR